MANQYKSIKRFQNINSLFNLLLSFWILYTIALLPIAKFNPSTFKFSTPLELKESINLATAESGDLIKIKDFSGKITFLKGALPKEYYYKVASMFFSSLFFIFIFYHLKGISQSIIDKKPFQLQNQKRLNYIGFILIGLAFLMPLLKLLNANHLPINDITCFSLNTDNSINLLGIEWNYLISGVGALLIAEVFKAGNELREENALTI